MVSNRLVPKMCSRRQEIRSLSPRPRSRAGKRARPPPKANRRAGNGLRAFPQSAFRPNETSTHPFRYTWNRSNFYCDVEVRVHVSLRDISFTKPCANQSGSLHPDLHL